MGDFSAQSRPHVKHRKTLKMCWQTINFISNRKSSNLKTTKTPRDTIVKSQQTTCSQIVIRLLTYLLYAGVKVKRPNHPTGTTRVTSSNSWVRCWQFEQEEIVFVYKHQRGFFGCRTSINRCWIDSDYNSRSAGRTDSAHNQIGFLLVPGSTGKDRQKNWSARKTDNEQTDIMVKIGGGERRVSFVLRKKPLKYSHESSVGPLRSKNNKNVQSHVKKFWNINPFRSVPFPELPDVLLSVVGRVIQIRIGIEDRMTRGAAARLSEFPFLRRIFLFVRRRRRQRWRWRTRSFWSTFLSSDRIRFRLLRVCVCVCNRLRVCVFRRWGRCRFCRLSLFQPLCNLCVCLLWPFEDSCNVVEIVGISCRWLVNSVAQRMCGFWWWWHLISTGG